MFLRNSSCSFQKDVAGFPAVRLCQNWWNAQDIISYFSVEEVNAMVNNLPFRLPAEFDSMRSYSELQ